MTTTTMMTMIDPGNKGSSGNHQLSKFYFNNSQFFSYYFLVVSISVEAVS